MAIIETIPIPSDKAERREPIVLEVNHLDVWPQQQFQVYLTWNSTLEHWMFEMIHSGHGTLFGKHPAQINHPYVFKKILQAVFVDLTGDATRVTPQNLGENVVLGVVAGEDSPGENPEQP